MTVTIKLTSKTTTAINLINFSEIINWKWLWQIIILVTLVRCIESSRSIVAVASLPEVKNNSQVQQETATTNLDVILSHQRALTKECRSIQAKKLKILREIGSLSMGHSSSNHFLTYEMPAVCMLILNWEPANGDRLAMINWFNEPLAINDSTVTSEEQHVRPRRRVGELGSSEPNPASLFSNYLLDTDKWNITEMKTNSLTPEESKLDRETEKLFNEEQSNFRQAINLYKDKLEPDLSPVILIPGLLGSRLQARLDKPSRVNVLCRKQSGNKWQEMWLSVKNFLPLLVDCWFDNARMVPDTRTGFTKSAPGVTVRVPDFGSVESVRVMDLSSNRVSRYFATIIEHYTQLGYTPDKNLLAAPYDFRLAPQQLGDYFQQLDELIETIESKTGLKQSNARPVTLVCHSMGCNHMMVYLRSKSAAWRREHIRKLIALSSPWGGAFKALKALVVGDQLDLPLVSESKMRQLARSFPSIAYLLPRPEVYANSNKRHLNSSVALDSNNVPIFVKTSNRQYDASQIEQLLVDMNLNDQLRWYEQTTDFVRPYEPIEDLRVDCVHGENIPTMESILFNRDEDFPNGPYELIKGEGDGTVNIESLKVCEQWEAKLGSKLVRNFAIYNTNHLGVLGHPQTLRLLTNDILLSD